VRALGSRDPVMGIPFFRGLASTHRGLNPLLPVSLEFQGRDPMASSILTPYNGCDLTPLRCRTWQNWSLVWKGDLLTTTLPHDQPESPGGFGIGPRLDAVATLTPASSGEGSHPQAILKLHHLSPSSLDYRARPNFWLNFGINSVWDYSNIK